MRDSSKMNIHIFFVRYKAAVSLPCPSGISVTGETIQCRNATSGLTARPAESEQPGAEINHFQGQQSLRKQPFIIYTPQSLHTEIIQTLIHLHDVIDFLL